MSSAQTDCAAAWKNLLVRLARTDPRLSLVSPKVFSLFCHRWSFGSLPLSPLACLVGGTAFPAISSTWLHRYYLNWTELDDDITEFNDELPLTENWVFTIVILHYWQTMFLFNTVKLLWHNLCYKHYINKGDLTWLNSWQWRIPGKWTGLPVFHRIDDRSAGSPGRAISGEHVVLYLLSVFISSKTTTKNIHQLTFFLWLRLDVDELKLISDDKNHDGIYFSLTSEGCNPMISKVMNKMYA